MCSQRQHKQRFLIPMEAEMFYKETADDRANVAGGFGHRSSTKQMPPTSGLLLVLLVVMKYNVMLKAQELDTSGSNPSSSPSC